MRSQRAKLTFRPINLLWGGLVGFTVGIGIACIGYAVKEDRPPFSFDYASFTSFFDFISWPWVAFLVALGALWGFLFNNWIGELLSDLFTLFR